MATLKRKFMTINQNKQYWQKLKALRPSAYYPLWESSGTVANELMGVGNGTITGATPGSAGVGGRLALSFDGTSDYVTIGTAGLISAFNGAAGGAEGSLFVLGKVSALGDWSDGSFRRLIHLYTDAQNTARIFRGGNNTLSLTHIAGNTTKSATLILNPTGWFCVGMTWSLSNNRLRTYLNGPKVLPADVTGLGTWVGALSAAAIGADAATPGSNSWKGLEGHALYFNREITEAESKIITSVLAPKVYTLIGDSIAAANNSGVSRAISSYPGGVVSCLINHAVAGNAIIPDLDTQVVAAASDNARIIIIALGTNDDNAGNMTTLQAECEENIIELKASNPAATLYWMNVLPRWTNNTTGPVVDKSNIRTAIAAACTAQNITCWDTFSTPWITQAQTTDGLHPGSAGQDAIATQILARL